MTQDEAMTLLTMGKNVFLTGAAGTGKSFVLERYIRWLRERAVEPAVTASTGIAASHIGGSTIHSWSGIGIHDHLSPYDLDRLEQNEALVKRVNSTHVLIIDEVSMLSAQTLGLVDQVLRTLRRTSQPFGGVQVVLCGDFFQLPPVVRGAGETPFAFVGGVWDSAGLHVCYLDEQFRQNDDALLALLNAIRDGTMNEDLGEPLRERIGCEVPDDVPHLYTHNVDVDAMNNERLAALPGTMYRFDRTVKGSKKNISILERGLLVPETLQIKEGAAVMFVKNHPQGRFVNGTLGTIVRIEAGVPVVRTRDGREIPAEPMSWKLEDGDKVRAEITQVPLRLAWAVTVHKSQGMTLDAAFIDLGKTFVPGQGYVALSRVRSIAGLYLANINHRVFERHPDVAHADDQFMRESARLVRRLEQTTPERLAELTAAFEQRIGAQEPDPDRPVRTPSAPKQSTLQKTAELVRSGCPLREIAHARGMTLGTIIGHVEKLRDSGALTQEDLAYLAEDMPPTVRTKICAAFARAKTDKLSPVHRALKGAYTYEELRYARLLC